MTEPIDQPAAAEAPTQVFRAPLLDPGWLLLIPGIILVAFTILLPAYDDLDQARFYRDNLARVEARSQQRMTNYNDFLQSVKRGDESTVVPLAAVQLNKAPEGLALLKADGEVAQTSASVFNRLEPAPIVLPQRVKRYSTLERLSIDRESRIWLMLAGATMIFIGILPQTSVRRG